MFQSTHPVWDATARLVDRPAVQTVSIHASRVGCDRICYQRKGMRPGFNPCIPCGMRRLLSVFPSGLHQFQSMHPVWDATGKPPGYVVRTTVSIHASRVGCDAFRVVLLQRPEVSIHASRVGCDFVQDLSLTHCRTFQSMHPVWDATAWKLTVDGQWCSCRFAPTCLSCCYLQVRSFYSNDVNVLKSRLYENRRSAGNFL